MQPDSILPAVPVKRLAENDMGQPLCPETGCGKPLGTYYNDLTGRVEAVCDTCWWCAELVEDGAIERRAG